MKNFLNLLEKAYPAEECIYQAESFRITLDFMICQEMFLNGVLIMIYLMVLRINFLRLVCFAAETT